MANARKIAIEALNRVETDLAYSNIVLNDIFANYKDITQQDKKLISALFYGVLDRKITIDYYINRLSKVKVRKMDPITKQSIRIGIYQIAFMDKVPTSAAVNESVNIVKNSKEKRNYNFVNAVLRNATRQMPALPNNNTAEGISVVYSCPLEIVKELIKDYGKQATISALESFLLPADFYVRVNTTLLSTNDFEQLLSNENYNFEKVEGKPAYKIIGAGDIFNSKIYKKGYFHVQDIASQNCAESLCVKEGERVLDVCAAPGGKTFTIAQLLKNNGEVVSCDLYESRTELIKKGAERLNLNCIKVLCNDASVYNKDFGLFDAVLCDVPCSGWGVMRRKPEIKYKQQESFDELKKIQQQILTVSSRYVKDNGRIIYSTCTLRKEENENNVKLFLENNSDFILEKQETTFPDKGSDGFYHAVLVKKF